MVGCVQVQLLTEQGFSYVMLHSSNATVRTLTCTGMNETRLVAAAPELQRPARAFGLSAAGELVALLLSGQNRIASCRVRYKRDLPMMMPAPNMAVLQAGALVTVDDRLHLLNTTSTSSNKSAKRTVLQHELAQLARCAPCTVSVVAVAATQSVGVRVGALSIPNLLYAYISWQLPCSEQGVHCLHHWLRCPVWCSMLWLCHRGLLALAFPGKTWHTGASVFTRCLI